MTERLDRIEAQQETNTANITDLITMSANLLQAADSNIQAINRLEAQVNRVEAQIAETSINVQVLRDSVETNEDRFNILVQEMRADRAAWLAETQRLRLEVQNNGERISSLESNEKNTEEGSV